MIFRSGGKKRRKCLLLSARYTTSILSPGHRKLTPAQMKPWYRRAYNIKYNEPNSSNELLQTRKSFKIEKRCKWSTELQPIYEKQDKIRDRVNKIVGKKSKIQNLLETVQYVCNTTWGTSQKLIKNANFQVF